MQIISRLDNQNINIEIDPNKQYGIMLSGGLDSAILFYLILKEFLLINSLPKIKIFTIPKHDGARLYIDNIVDFLKKEFNVSLPSTIEIGDPDVYHGDQSKVALTELFQKYPEIDYVYMATNQNPPQEFILPGTYPNRVKNSGSPRVLLPFIKLYKTHILDLIFENNVQELINITHSCTEQKIGRCNQCFQCHERKWAFEQLSKKDTGTL